MAKFYWYLSTETRETDTGITGRLESNDDISDVAEQIRDEQSCDENVAMTLHVTNTDTDDYVWLKMGGICRTCHEPTWHTDDDDRWCCPGHEFGRCECSACNNIATHTDDSGCAVCDECDQGVRTYGADGDENGHLCECELAWKDGSHIVERWHKCPYCDGRFDPQGPSGGGFTCGCGEWWKPTEHESGEYHPFADEGSDE